MLLFPIIIWYFSPYLIIMGATQGVINGSFIVFCSMFVLSIFFGRIFCGYLCPMSGLQECLSAVNNRVPKQGWKNYIKYFIWTIWLCIIVFCFINQKQTIQINFFYQTDHGISVANIYA
jgi:ferredoxin-type protein NapH